MAIWDCLTLLLHLSYVSYTYNIININSLFHTLIQPYLDWGWGQTLHIAAVLIFCINTAKLSDFLRNLSGNNLMLLIDSDVTMVTNF